MENEKSKSIVTLAALTVRDGKIETKSNGVTYDPATGVVGFPNPRDLTFVPVISDIAGGGASEDYITTTNFIRAIGLEGKTNQFRVWQTALDTGNRNWPPSDFSAVVVGF